MTGATTPHPTGYALLHNPRLNKGTAFTETERRAYGLEGLLPPAVTNIELQVARRHAEIANLDDDLQKYLVLNGGGGGRSLQAGAEFFCRVSPGELGAGQFSLARDNVPGDPLTGLIDARSAEPRQDGGRRA